jgi:hypothetical protein
VHPEELAFLDEVEWAVDAARQVGIHGVRFESTTQAIAEIDALLPAHPGGEREGQDQARA